MKNNLKNGSRSLVVGFGILMTAFCLSCNSKTSSADSTEMSSDTSAMGLQGDTTSNTMSAPQTAPSDTATGQTLPEMRATKKN